MRHKQARIHELSSYLMLSKPEDISRVTRSAGGELSRHDLMDRLQEFLPASIMLPPRRLATLIGQAAEFQVKKAQCILLKLKKLRSYDRLPRHYRSTAAYSTINPQPRQAVTALTPPAWPWTIIAPRPSFLAKPFRQGFTPSCRLSYTLFGTVLPI